MRDVVAQRTADRLVLAVAVTILAREVGRNQHVVSARHLKTIADGERVRPLVERGTQRCEGSTNLQSRIQSQRKVLRALDLVPIRDLFVIVLDDLVAQERRYQGLVNGHVRRCYQRRVDGVGIGLIVQAGGITLCPAIDQTLRQSAEQLACVLLVTVLADDGAVLEDGVDALVVNSRYTGGPA